MSERIYCGPVRSMSRAPIAGAKHSGQRPQFFSPGRPDVFPRGTALIVEVRSGYGYSFWHVAYVLKDLVLKSGRELGGSPAIYYGKYQQFLSTLQGLPAGDVRYVIGEYDREPDIPAEYFDLCDEWSNASLDGKPFVLPKTGPAK